MNLENVKVLVNKTEVEAVKVNGVTLVNMTPHEVNYYSEGKQIFTVPVSGLPAIRLPEENVNIHTNYGMEFTTKQYKEAENLPNEQDNVLFIVSKMVLDAVNRNDFIAPDTGDGAVRDVDGTVTGRKGNILGTTRWVVA